MRCATPLPTQCIRAIFCLLMVLFYGQVKAQEEARYNRFQYHKFHWRVFRAKSYSIYFPAEAQDSLYRYVAKETPVAIETIRKAAIKDPPRNLNIIVYPSVHGFYETNIGAFETAPVTFPTFIFKGTRIVLDYNGSYSDLKMQLYEGIARALWEAQIKDNGPADKAPQKGKSKPLTKDADIPMWFKEGVIRYFAHGWLIEGEDKLRVSFEKNNFTSWQEVLNYEPRLGGEAFCNFINHKYYPNAIAQTFFQLKKKKSLRRAIRLTTRRELDTLYSQCFTYYQARYKISVKQDDATMPDIKIAHPKGIVQKVLVSPAKDFVVYTLLSKGRRTVWLYNVKTAKQKKITGYKLPPWIDDHSPDQYPLLQWHKDGHQLYVAKPRKGKIEIRRYKADGALAEITKIPGVDGISTFQPLSDREFLLGAYIKGQSDIVSFNDNTDKFTSYTDDEYDDAQPVLTPENDLIFVSNRPKEYTEQRIYLIGVGYKKDTLCQGLYIIKDKKVIPMVIDSDWFVKWEHPVLLPDGQILVTSTKTGSERSILVNYKTGVQMVLNTDMPVQYISGSNEITSYLSGADSIYLSSTPLEKWLQRCKAKQPDTTSPWLTDYHKQLQQQAKDDSLLKKGRDTTHYIMDDIFSMKEDTSVKKGNRHLKRIVRKTEDTEPYFLQLHSAYFTAQVNNDYFINRYQPYAAYMGQFKFPEVGGMTRGGFTDLFENHNFAIAFRLPAATQGSDFSASYENTERKIDWGLSFTRKVETLQPNQNTNWVDENGRQYPGNAKVKTHYYSIFLKRPLTYDCLIGFETALRQDRTVFLATDKYSLDFPLLQSAWSINTISFKMNKLHPTLANLYRGFKLDAYVDGFKGFDKDEAFVLGTTLNLSYHQPLYKYITLATQLHTGYSGGDAKILYNLGGVNNNVTPRVDTNVHFTQNAPYAFQTLVTPFRGWYQNSLYGNEYALLNFDVYFPIFQTLIPLTTPLPFINNLRLGALSDIATAKETWNPARSGMRLWSYGLSAGSNLAGYPLKIEVAWPGTFSKQPVWYFSLSLQ